MTSLAPARNVNRHSPSFWMLLLMAFTLPPRCPVCHGGKVLYQGETPAGTLFQCCNKYCALYRSEWEGFFDFEAIKDLWPDEQDA